MKISARLLALAMSSVFLVGVVIGYAVSPVLKELVSLLGEQESWLLREKFFLLTLILSNNLRVLLIVAASGLIVVGPAAVMLINGVVVGAVLALASTRLPLNLLALSVLPHGVIEVPAFVYSAALSTIFGVEVWKRILKRDNNLGEAAVSFLKGLLLSMLLIVIAAFVEVYVTLPLIEESIVP